MLRADVERVTEGEALRRDLDQAIAPAPRDLERPVARTRVDHDHLRLDGLPAQRDERPLEKLLLVLAADYHRDRKSTRLNSSHANISYAVFCLKKKTQIIECTPHFCYPH